MDTEISKELLFFLLAIASGTAGFFGTFWVKSLAARMKSVEDHSVDHVVRIVAIETNETNTKDSLDEIKVDVKDIKRDIKRLLLEKKK